MVNSKKILFFTLPAYGHVSEIFFVIKKLAESNDVTVYTSDKFKDFFNTIPNLNIVTYGSVDTDFIFSRNPIELSIYLNKISKEIIKNIDISNLSPDMVFYDTYAVWGGEISKKINTKCISYSPSYSQNWSTFLPASLDMPSLKYWVSIYKYGRKAFLSKGFNTFRDFSKILPAYAKKHICLIPDVLQPKLSSNKSHIYAAPSLDVNHTLGSIKDVVYLSLGTLYLDKEILLKYINIFKKLNLKTIVSAGTYAGELKEYQDENIKIFDFVDQKNVLSSAYLFVTHAGTNSVIESIGYSVPMICLPQAVDQYSFASLVQKNKFGEYFNQTWDSKKTEEKIKDFILNIDLYKNNIERYKKNFKKDNLDRILRFIEVCFNKQNN